MSKSSFLNQSPATIVRSEANPVILAAIIAVGVLGVAMIINRMSPGPQAPAVAPVSPSPATSTVRADAAAQWGLCRFSVGVETANVFELPSANGPVRLGAPCDDGKGNSGEWIAVLPKRHAT